MGVDSSNGERTAERRARIRVAAYTILAVTAAFALLQVCSLFGLLTLVQLRHIHFRSRYRFGRRPLKRKCGRQRWPRPWKHDQISDVKYFHASLRISLEQSLRLLPQLPHLLPRSKAL